MRALVANDPRVYREVIAGALSRARPLIEVIVAEPEELEREVARLRPHLVISSRSSPAVRESCPVWVVLYPDGEDRAEVGGVGVGEVALLCGAQVGDLLSVVDEAGLRSA